MVDGHAGSVACRELEGARGVGLLGLRHDEEVRARERGERLAQPPRGQERAARVGRRRVEEDDVEVALERDVGEAVVEEVDGHGGLRALRPGAAPRARFASATIGTRGSGAREERRLVARVAHGRERHPRRPRRRRSRGSSARSPRVRIEGRHPRARSSPASQRTNGVLPVPPAATLPTERTGRPARRTGRRPRPVGREARRDGRAVEGRERVERPHAGRAPVEERRGRPRAARARGARGRGEERRRGRGRAGARVAASARSGASASAAEARVGRPRRRRRARPRPSRGCSRPRARRRRALRRGAARGRCVRPSARTCPRGARRRRARTSRRARRPCRGGGRRRAPARERRRGRSAGRRRGPLRGEPRRGLEVVGPPRREDEEHGGARRRGGGRTSRTSGISSSADRARDEDRPSGGERARRGGEGRRGRRGAVELEVARDRDARRRDADRRETLGVGGACARERATSAESGPEKSADARRYRAAERSERRAFARRTGTERRRASRRTAGQSSVSTRTRSRGRSASKKRRTDDGRSSGNGRHGRPRGPARRERRPTPAGVVALRRSGTPGRSAGHFGRQGERHLHLAEGDALDPDSARREADRAREEPRKDEREERGLGGDGGAQIESGQEFKMRRHAAADYTAEGPGGPFPDRRRRPGKRNRG